MSKFNLEPDTSATDFIDDESSVAEIDTSIAEDDGEAWSSLIEEFESAASKESEVPSDDEVDPPQGEPTETDESLVVDIPVEEGEVVDPSKPAPSEDTPPADEESDDLNLPEPVVPVAEAPQAVTAEQLALQRQQFKEQVKKTYAMSEEMAQRFEENPTEVLAEFAADTHLRIMESVLSVVKANISQVVKEATHVDQTSAAREVEFFNAWPELKGHNAVIARVAKTFREQNPAASKEDAILAVGYNTLVSLGVDPVKAAKRLTRFQAIQEAPAAVEESVEVIPPHKPKPGGTNSKRSSAPPAPTLWSEFIDD